MDKLRPLLVAVPSALGGALLLAASAGTARAQFPSGISLPAKIAGRSARSLPEVAPPVRPANWNDAWEYRYYFCGANEACAQDGARQAYGDLNRLGEAGWEAYGYTSTPGKGFNWELKRRR